MTILKKARQLLSDLGVQGIITRTFEAKRIFVIFSYKKDMHANFAKSFMGGLNEWD